MKGKNVAPLSARNWERGGPPSAIATMQDGYLMELFVRINRLSLLFVLTFPCKIPYKIADCRGVAGMLLGPEPRLQATTEKAPVFAGERFSRCRPSL